MKIRKSSIKYLIIFCAAFLIVLISGTYYLMEQYRIYHLPECRTIEIIPTIKEYGPNYLTLQLDNGTNLNIGQTISYELNGVNYTIKLLDMDPRQQKVELYYRFTYYSPGEDVTPPGTVNVECKKTISLNDQYYQTRDPILWPSPYVWGRDWSIEKSFEYTPHNPYNRSPVKDYYKFYVKARHKIADVAEAAPIRAYFDYSIYENEDQAQVAFEEDKRYYTQQRCAPYDKVDVNSLFSHFISGNCDHRGYLYIGQKFNYVISIYQEDSVTDFKYVVSLAEKRFLDSYKNGQ